MADSMKTWTEIEINKETHLIASQNVNERCTVILTNLKDVWLEELTVAEATEKCRKLNPFLVMEDFNFERVITHLFYNVSRSIVQPATREKIKLEMTLLGSTLQYEIDLKRGSARQVWKEIILPLCISVGQLMSQKRSLIAEIRKRDAEISEYQCLNAEILTKNRVQPYSAEAIRGNNVMNSLNECLRVFTIVAHDPTVADAKEELFKKENIETNCHCPYDIGASPKYRPESEEREKAGSSKQETVVQSEDKGPSRKTESDGNQLTTSGPMESKLTESGDDNRSTVVEIDFFDSIIDDSIRSPSAKLRKIRKPRK